MKKIILAVLIAASAFSVFAVDLPKGYGGVELGMSLDETKSALKKNADFGYHGDRDVSLLPGENRVLIETDAETGFGSSFLGRCWFQFYEESLYIITINVNPSKMDYYSVFTALSEKYGIPGFLNPEKAVWENDSVIMSLEKPLTLKYTDKKVFDNLQKKSSIDKGSAEKLRDKFLDEL